MKILILTLILSGGLLFGAIPTSGVTNGAGDKTSAPYIEPELSTVGDMSEYKAKVKASGEAIKSTIIGGSAKAGDSFFNTSAKSSCDSAESLKCPPLKSQYAGTYTTMINYINPAEGKVGCTVYDTSKDIFNVRNGDDLGVPVISEVITVSACVNKFKPENNRVEDQSTTQMRDIAANRAKQLNNITSNYSNTNEKGGIQYLDLGDLLDAMSTIDGQKIDIQSSLAKGDLSTMSRYTLNNKAAFLNADANIRELVGKQNPTMTPTQISKVINDASLMRERNKSIGNSQYIMFLGYWVAADKAIGTLLNAMIFFFIIYNALIQWAGGSLSFKINNWLVGGGKNQPRGENHLHRGFAGFAIIVMFFSGSVEKYEVKDLVTGQQVTQEVKQQRIRDIIRIIFGVSNDLSDELARIGISQYLKYLTLTSGVSGVDRIDAYSTEKQILLKENGILHQIDSTMCGIYNTDKYKEVVLENEQKMKDLKVSSSEEVAGLEKIVAEIRKSRPQDKDYTAALDLEINPFPKTEKIAFDTFGDKNFDPPLNPYSSDAGVFPGANGAMFMSMSGCYNNRAKILENNRKIEEATIAIKKIAEEQKNTLSLDRIKGVYELMWRSYSELGYMSVIFLPATSILIDSQGVLGDKAVRDEKGESWDQEIARALPVLALFGGENIKNMVSKTATAPLYALKETYEKSAVGTIMDKIGVGGLVTASATIAIEVYTYQVTYSVINSMLNAVSIIAAIMAGVIAFVMLTLQKLYVFMSVIFLAIWAFHPNQESKILSAFGKIISVSFKTVLLTVSMFLVIFTISLIDSLEYRLINDFFVVMQSTPTVSLADTLNPFTTVGEWMKSTLHPYIFYGLAHLGFIFVKLYAIYMVVFKLPSYFMEIINDKGEDMFDRATQGLGDAAEKATKGGM